MIAEVMSTRKKTRSEQNCEGTTCVGKNDSFLSLVRKKLSAGDLDAAHGSCRVPRVLDLRELSEAEAPRLTRVPVHDHPDLGSKNRERKHLNSNE